MKRNIREWEVGKATPVLNNCVYKDHIEVKKSRVDTTIVL